MRSLTRVAPESRGSIHCCWRALDDHRFEPGRHHPDADPSAATRSTIAGSASSASTKPRRPSTWRASFRRTTSCCSAICRRRFSLVGDPVVTVEFHYMTASIWLAAGYTMIHVSWPARSTARQTVQQGDSLLVGGGEPRRSNHHRAGRNRPSRAHAEVHTSAKRGRRNCMRRLHGFRFLNSLLLICVPRRSSTSRLLPTER